MDTNKENTDSGTLKKILDIEQVISQPSTPWKVKDKGIVVSPHLSENTPRKQILRTALVNTRKL